MLNEARIIGHVGNDPELKAFSNGNEVANLTVATTERWTDKSTGERKEKTEWHRVAIFNPWILKVVKSYVSKGSKLYISGKLQTRKWQDSNGADKYTTEIVLQGPQSTLLLLDSKDAQSHDHSGSPMSDVVSSNNSGAVQPNSPNELDDEIPF